MIACLNVAFHTIQVIGYATLMTIIDGLHTAHTYSIAVLIQLFGKLPHKLHDTSCD